MDSSRTPRHPRLRTPRGPPTPFQARHPGRLPNRHIVPNLGPGPSPFPPGSLGPYAVRQVPDDPISPRSAAAAAMEDDAITTLMDIDDSPRSAAGAGFLDDDDEEGDLLHAHRMGGRANEVRGPLAFTGFFNAFDGADFDDSDLA